MVHSIREEVWLWYTVRRCGYGTQYKGGGVVMVHSIREEVWLWYTI